MNIFRDLNMGVKLGLGFGFILLLVCILGLMTYQAMSDNAADADIIAKEYIPAIALATKMQKDFDSAAIHLRTYSTTRVSSNYDMALKYIESIRKSMNAMQTIVDTYPSLTKCKEFMRVFPGYFTGYIEYSEETNRQIQAEAKLNDTMTILADTVDKALSEQVEAMIHLAESTIGSSTGLTETALNNMERAQQVRALFLILRRDITAANIRSDTQLLQKAIENMEALDLIMDALRASAVSRASMDVVDETREQLEAYHDHMGTLKSLWIHLNEADQKRMGLYDKVVTALSALSDDGFLLTQEQANATSASNAKSLRRVATLIVTVLVLGIIISLFLTRLTTIPLRLSLEFAQGVASGNLDQKLDVHSKDEVGKVCDAMRSMVDTLKQKIQEANHQSEMAKEKEQLAVASMHQAERATQQAERAKSEGMSAAAMRLEGTIASMSAALSQLAAQIGQSEKGAVTQASRVTETVTAMEEMTATVLEVARSAGEASNISQKTRQKALEGADVVQSAVDGILQVQKGALAMREDMTALDQHSQAISQIMGVISDIADQTNLLALNAAIEAARAGEAGRGFAVVADEVRKLAEKTMSSTTDVGNAIHAIQQSAGRSMARVEETVQNVDECSAGAMKSGTALKEIVALADETADQVQAIATASEQQSLTSEEIDKAVGHVNVIASETATNMQEAARSVNALAEQAEDLSRLVEELKRG